MVPRSGLTTTEQIEDMLEYLAHAKKKPKHRLKQMWNTFATILLILFTIILFHVIQMKQNGQIPNVFGYYLFSIESGSMSPTLQVGDVILSKKPSNTEDLVVGTIVTYYTTEGQVVTHRITEVVKDDSGVNAYQTKGDYEKNTTDLELLTQDLIIAIYCSTFKRA